MLWTTLVTIFVGILRCYAWQAPPTISDMSYAKGTEDGVAQIMCHARGYPVPKMVWQKEGSDFQYAVGHNADNIAVSKKLIRDPDNAGAKLIIRFSKLRFTDAGLYRCTATNNAGTTNKTANLVVHSPPTISDMSYAKGTEDGVAQIMCHARGYPVPKMVWQKEGSDFQYAVGHNADNIAVSKKLIRDPDNAGAKLIIRFSKLRFTDAGLYRCTATNNAGTTNKTANLVVHSPPTISDMSYATGTEDGVAQIMCHARGYPVPKMVWQKEGSDFQYAVGHNADNIAVSKKLIRDPDNAGAKLIIRFFKLRYTDAGLYRCTATNDAGTTNKTANLELLFKPNFVNQETGPFYTWTNNENAVIPCAARGNRLPVFTWYKEQNNIKRKIAASDSAYSTIRVEDPDDEFLITSKLTVSYDGANDAVFGDYTCSAKNSIGETEQILQLMKADRPGQPTVDMSIRSATKMIFWLYYEPTGIRGPPITNFKVVYKIQGSADQALTKIVAREHRPEIDFDRKYTIIELMDLKDSSSYVFTFYAISPVGDGQPLERQIQTPAISAPGMVRFVEDTANHTNSDHASRLLVRWYEPTTGGAVITKYQLTYQRVNVKTNGSSNPSQGYELNNPITESVLVENIKDTQKMITGLIPGSYYQVNVTAWNIEGAGTAGVKIFKMKDAPLDRGASTDPSYKPVSGAPKTVSVPIPLTICCCLATLSACLTRAFV